MKQHTPVNLEFVNPFEHVEIFCRKKYRNYHIRGQIKEFQEEIYDPSFPDGSGRAYYRLKILALIKDDCDGTAKICRENYDHFGTLLGKTLLEFNAIQRDFELEKAKDDYAKLNTPLKTVFKNNLKSKNPPVVINIKDVHIERTPYLINALETGKDVILLKVEISLDRVGRPINYRQISHPNCIHRLLGNIDKRSDVQSEHADFIMFLWGLYNILHFNLSYAFKDKNEYEDLLGAIGALSLKTLALKDITKKLKKDLNAVIHATRDRGEPFYDFCYQFVADLFDDLKKRKIALQCRYCHEAIPFHIKRRYCHPETEGKDCSTHAAYHRDYEKHKEKRRVNARKHMQVVRADNKLRALKKASPTETSP